MTYQHAQKFAERVSCMGREELIDLLRHLRCPFDLDFTDQFLEEAGMDRLRHIVMSAILHAEKVPADGED
jgi:hypothetical protein